MLGPCLTLVNILCISGPVALAMQVPQPHMFPDLGGSNGEVLRFRFAITWSYLSTPRAAAPKVPEPPPQMAPLALSRGSDPPPRPVANTTGAAPKANDQW